MLAFVAEYQIGESGPLQFTFVAGRDKGHAAVKLMRILREELRELDRAAAGKRRNAKAPEPPKLADLPITIMRLWQPGERR